MSEAAANKELFKKIILSFFPRKHDDLMNSTGLFVSFISTKQFFSLVNRKIVENYKLNLFDIALDPFEVKVGFGDTPGIRVKDIDSYYGYACVANLNGYRFFSPSVIGHVAALVVSMYTHSLYKKTEQEQFVALLYTVYLLAFVFAARIKIFPEGKLSEQYQWFVQVFFLILCLCCTENEASSFRKKIIGNATKCPERTSVVFYALVYVPSFRNLV